MADDAKAQPQSPLANAADRIRSASQWLIGAFAAVGALLAAGLQIASIGHLNTDDHARLWAAFGGIGLAVLGIVVAISAAAAVSAQSDVTLRWLVETPESEAAKRVDSDSALRQGQDLDKLTTAIDTAATEAGTRYEAVVEFGDPGTDTAKQAQAAGLLAAFDKSNAELNRLKRIRSDVLDVASFYRVKEAFDNAKRWMAGGAVAAAIGITAFAWGANPPASTKLRGGDVLPKTPSDVTVVLSKAGMNRYGAGIRKNTKCNLSNLPAVAFAVSHTTYDVVTLASENCRVQRLTITPARGQVIPRVKGS